ncbi:DedA family protein [Leifsonia xyli]|uniref:DedA family protein n=1 Tax=Leifsonia xyli TaxID=1575 RepID=UPI003D67B39F
MAHDLAHFLGDVGPLLFYLAVWGLVFAGTGLFVGVFIPFITGDSLLFAAGILTGTHPELSIWVLAIGVGIAAVLGDQVGFWLGRSWAARTWRSAAAAGCRRESAARSGSTSCSAGGPW